MMHSATIIIRVSGYVNKIYVKYYERAGSWIGLPFNTSPFKVVFNFQYIEENILKMLSKRVFSMRLSGFRVMSKGGILNITWAPSQSDLFLKHSLL